MLPSLASEAPALLTARGARHRRGWRHVRAAAVEWSVLRVLIPEAGNLLLRHRLDGTGGSCIAWRALGIILRSRSTCASLSNSLHWTIFSSIAFLGERLARCVSRLLAPLPIGREPRRSFSSCRRRVLQLDAIATVQQF